MLSLVLARRIARPLLALPALSVARWYAAAAATHAGFSTDGERLIHQKLTEKFTPSELRVEDVSGASRVDIFQDFPDRSPFAGGCGTFYNIIIASEQFKGLSLVKQQRLVNQTLKEEIQGIHGLQVCRTFLVCIGYETNRFLVENYCPFIDQGSATDHAMSVSRDIVCTTVSSTWKYAR